MSNNSCGNCKDCRSWEKSDSKLNIGYCDDEHFDAEIHPLSYFVGPEDVVGN